MKATRLVPVVSALALALCSGTLLAAGEEKEYADFLKQVRDEMKVAEQARASGAASATTRGLGFGQGLLDEASVRHALRLLSPPSAPQAKNTAEPRADAAAAAQRLVESERQRQADLQAERTGLLIETAKEHVKDGRLTAASLALKTALAGEPGNPEAARLLQQVSREAAAVEARNTARAREAETSAALRSVDAARIPLTATLTLPADWPEKSARALAEQARVTALSGADERAAVNRALAKQVSIDVVEMPLADVAAYLRHVGGVNIVVEKDAAEKKISLQLKDVTLASALDWAVKQADLARTIRGNCIHIGSPERVAEEPVTRVYDVSDILHVQHLLTRGHKMRRGALGGEEEGPFEQVESKSFKELADDLIGFLRDVTGRKLWADGGGNARMDMRLGRLVVNAEPSLQEKILEILEGVRP